MNKVYLIAMIILSFNIVNIAVGGNPVITSIMIGLVGAEIFFFIIEVKKIRDKRKKREEE